MQPLCTLKNAWLNLQVVLGFELTPATALSHTIVATSAVASSIYGLIAQSPNDPRRTLIDWDLTIFIPALLVGVSIGKPFHAIFSMKLTGLKGDQQDDSFTASDLAQLANTEHTEAMSGSFWRSWGTPMQSHAMNKETCAETWNASCQNAPHGL